MTEDCNAIGVLSPIMHTKGNNATITGGFYGSAFKDLVSPIEFFI